jgi:hypothetical protein
MTHTITPSPHGDGAPARRSDPQRAGAAGRPLGLTVVAANIVEHLSAGMRELCLSDLHVLATWGVAEINNDGEPRYVAFDELAVGCADGGRVTLSLYCRERCVHDLPLDAGDADFAELMVENAPALVSALRRERAGARTRYHGLTGPPLTAAIRAATQA